MRIFKRGLPVLLFMVVLIQSAAAQNPPSVQKSKDEPVKYTGSLKPDKHYYDGLLPHTVGVHHFQVMRANRSHPPERGDAENTGSNENRIGGDVSDVPEGDHRCFRARLEPVDDPERADVGHHSVGGRRQQ